MGWREEGGERRKHGGGRWEVRGGRKVLMCLEMRWGVGLVGVDVKRRWEGRMG